MDDKLNRLTQVGFRPAGRWLQSGETLRFTLEPSVMHEQNLLYAFAVDGKLMYVGKTTQSLLKRMQAYRSPASNAERGGSTNIKNNCNICAALASGANVEIFVLHSLPQQQHGEFAVNLSAGLEDSLIKALAPPWNGKALSSSTVVLAGPPGEIASVPLPPLRAPLRPGEDAGIGSPGANAPMAPSVSGLPSAQTLLAYCKSKQGERLMTLARGNPFTIEIVGPYLEITPGTSRTPRREPKSNIDAVLARLAQKQSFRMSDYQDISFNASYLLALVKLWQQDTAMTGHP